MNKYYYARCAMYMVGIALVCMSLVTHAEQTKPVVFQSEQTAGTLLELYTSEGCSSCPPAEHWVSSLSEHPEAFKTLFPVAFHVDYWNYLGWPDRFAQNAFSQRQRKLHQQGLVNGVYTPAVLVGSRAWQGWRSGKALPTKKPVVGQLRAELNGQQLRVTFDNAAKHTLNLAYVGMGLTTQVTAGENIHRVLKHDFVVLEHWQQGAGNAWSVTLPPQPALGQTQTGLVLWVTPPNSEQVVQVTGTRIRLSDSG